MNAAELLAAKKLRDATLEIEIEGGDPLPLKVRALKRKDYRDLMDAHPSDNEDEDWNPDTFPPALIAAAAVEPEFTLEEATQLWDEWEIAEAARVFLVCFNLNENPAGVSFMLPGFGKTDDSGLNSTIASPLE